MAGALTLTYGAFTFEVMPQFIEQNNVERDSEGTPISVTRTWALEGFVTIPKATIDDDRALDIATKYIAIKSAFIGLDGTVDAVLKDGLGRTLLELKVADSDTGPQVTDGPSITQALEGLFATNLQFSITLASKEKITGVSGGIDDDLLEDEETTSLDVDGCGIITKTVAGNFKTIKGVSATTKLATKDPGTPSGYERQNSNTTISKDDRTASFSFVDKQRRGAALPTGVCNATLTRTVSVGDGKKITTISGELEAKTSAIALFAAKALKPLGKSLITEQTGSTEREGTATFTYAYEERSGFGDYHVHIEVVSYRVQEHIQNLKVKGTGARDFRQKTANPSFTARVSGRRESFKRFVSPPSDLYPIDDRTENEITHSFEQKHDRKGARVYVTEWSRSYIPLDDVGIISPHLT